MLFFWHELDSTAEETRWRVTNDQQTWKWEMWKLLHTYRFLSKTLWFKGISISKEIQAKRILYIDYLPFSFVNR